MSSNGSAAFQVALPSRICISIGEASPENLLRLAHAEAHRGETLFEFCLEFLADPYDGPGVVRDFVRRWPDAWVIVTCRKGEHCFHGSVDQQLALLSASIGAGGRGVDLEVATAAHNRHWMREIGRHCVRIISYHNYHAAPPLTPILQSLESVPADIIKVAVAAQDAQTLCELIQQARQYPRPSIFLAMGPSGIPTRILGAYAGRSFTYASLRSSTATAVGQLDVQTLREIYRLDEVNAATAFIAGFPGTANELSEPVEYNEILARKGNAHMIYVPWPGSSTVPPLLFKAAMQIRGMALESHFTNQVRIFADQVDMEAENAGIIDTLWKHQGRWHAGWKLGNCITNLLQTTLAPRARVAVVSCKPRQLEAVERLIRSYGYSIVAPSRAECSVNLAEMTFSQSDGINKINLRNEVIQRQVECWLGE